MIIKFCIALVLLAQGFAAAAQKKTVKAVQRFPVKGQLVVFKHWGNRSVAVAAGFFKETAPGIIKQIGKAEYEQVKRYCGSSHWPEAMRIPFTTDSADRAACEAKLNQLKMYRICTYRHIYKGKKFQRYAIVRVPYAENKDWDTGAVWKNSVYFLVQENDLAPVNKPRQGKTQVIPAHAGR